MTKETRILKITVIIIIRDGPKNKIPMFKKLEVKGHKMWGGLQSNKKLWLTENVIHSTGTAITLKYLKKKKSSQYVVMKHGKRKDPERVNCQKKREDNDL